MVRFVRDVRVKHFYGGLETPKPHLKHAEVKVHVGPVAPATAVSLQVRQQFAIALFQPALRGICCVVRGLGVGGVFVSVS